jgi:hypothetical protein
MKKSRSANFAAADSSIRITSADPSTFIDNQIAPAGRIGFNDSFKVPSDRSG